MTVVWVSRRCRSKWVWVFSLQNTPDWLVILLSVLHHRGSLLPLLLKLLFSPFGFFLFFCHPFFELNIFALESPRRDQLLFKLPGDFLLLSFLLVSDSLLSDLDHLRVIFWVIVLRLQLSIASELPKSVPLKDASACGNLGVSVGSIWIGSVNRCLSLLTLRQVKFLLLLRLRGLMLSLRVVWLYFVQRKLGDRSLKSLALACGIAGWTLRALLVYHHQILVVINVLRRNAHPFVLESLVLFVRVVSDLSALLLTFYWLLDRCLQLLFLSFVFAFLLASLSYQGRWRGTPRLRLLRRRLLRAIKCSSVLGIKCASRL